MAEKYFDYDTLNENDFFEFSSLTSLAVFRRVKTKNEADNIYSQFQELKHHFLALFYCAWFPHFLSLKEGPLSEHSLIKLENLITCPSYFLLNEQNSLIYYWASIFLALKRLAFRNSHKVDIISNDILTYLGHADHLSRFSVIPKVVVHKDCYEAQLFCTFVDKPIIMLRMPNVPSIKNRILLDQQRRPETLWNEKSFYDAHEKLVNEVWDELDPVEQKVFIEAQKVNKK